MTKLKTVLINSCLMAISLLLIFSPCVAYAKDKPITLKMSVMHGPKAGKYKYGHKLWAEAVEKATDGKVKVNLFPSNSLAPARENYDATINGLVDIGFIALVHYSGRFPLADVLSVPGAPIENPKQASHVAWNLYNKYPEFQKQFKDVKMLFLFGFSPIIIATTDKPIRTMEDLKGLRLRQYGRGGADFLKLAGASPIAMPPAELFLNLQKGVIDGNAMGWEGQWAFGAAKLCKYYTDAPVFPALYFAMFMNKNKWNKLPVDVQKGIMSVSGKAGLELYSDGDMKTIEEVVSALKSEGKEMIALSDEEKKRWANTAKPIADKMIEKISKKEKLARQFYDDMVQMAESSK